MRLGICASKSGLQLLEPLLASAELDAIAVPSHLLDPARPQLIAASAGHRQLLQQHWDQLELLVACLAAGALIRLMAPLLTNKDKDPAVLLISGDGSLLLPLLGSHGAGGRAAAERLAPLLTAKLVSSGWSDSADLPPLDQFGKGWGWQRNQAAWQQLMVHTAAGAPLSVHQECGQALALRALNEAGHQLVQVASGEQAALRVTAQLGHGCCWHPPLLWLGVGCERNTATELVEAAVVKALAVANLATEAVAGLASLNLKADEPALLRLSNSRDWPLRLFTPEQLAPITVPNPSPIVQAAVGTASVAEAAALKAAGSGAVLRLAKTVTSGEPGRGAVTVAIAEAAEPWAPQRGQLQLIGSGPGAIDQLTAAARAALACARVWVGYGLYLDLLEPLRRGGQIRLDGSLTQERQRCRQALDLACQGVSVALISSGDSGMYGMAGLALEEWLLVPEKERPNFAVHPGISAFQMAAARLGAPLMHDLCTVSLSDRLTPWPLIEQRLQAAARGDFVVALYNPRSQGRHWQLSRAIELLLEHRPGATPTAICRQLSRADEQISLHTLAALPVERVDMFSLVLVGNSTTSNQGGLLLTQRGYN
jgi:cobalt-precorrin 5A hydrolase/precorrin-3B C17-methyltransferase